MEIVNNKLGVFGDVRDGERPRTWYRESRVFTRNRSWYFHTREGIEVGPYTCEFDAELELEVLISKLQCAKPDIVSKIVQNHVSEARSGNSTLNTEAFTDYLVEVGGIELLRKEYVA